MKYQLILGGFIKYILYLQAAAFLVAAAYPASAAISQNENNAETIQIPLDGQGISEKPIDLIYKYSHNGDYDAAFALAKKQTESGDIEAEVYLAWSYDNGKGTEINLELARFHYKNAAIGGNVYAQWCYGVMLDSGLGGAEDPVEAFKWIEKSFEAGSIDATVSMGAMYGNGRGVRQDYAKAREYYEIAASKASNEAFTNIGRIYFHGQGTQIDQLLGLAYFCIGGELGSKNGHNLCDELRPDLTDEQIALLVDEMNNIIVKYNLSFGTES
ncbi:hypothetical protein LPB140_04510 [Sphingorhabdus lutea]|uniref:Sel1 repeat family protein n=1 Tax=Sphingorhabdus lutea TaxID=1913578 RepID=A0A1L3JAM5_9SPHN|nr:tetratricopeptide repeat protein [Sphingorhabdus lutea]APG62190.1 hypothetical protein LPB140_04510 [Sphingorhabdus lutea]